MNGIVIGVFGLCNLAGPAMNGFVGGIASIKSSEELFLDMI